jgi:hypothetical protein
MLGLFNETTNLTATVDAQSWSPTGQPATNANQNQSWQGVYLVTADGPCHILRADSSNPDAVASSADGARIVANVPVKLVLGMGDELSYIRGDDADADVNLWITRIANK